MNERIKALKEQAMRFAQEKCEGQSRDMYGTLRADIMTEKFAELIVRECAGLFPNVYVEIENEYGHTPVIAADYIKEHFGVEP